MRGLVDLDVVGTVTAADAALERAAFLLGDAVLAISAFDVVTTAQITY